MSPGTCPPNRGKTTHSASAFYNPSEGRWLSRDPIAEKGGINVYAFVRNRVATDYDFFGLAGLHVPICIGPIPLIAVSLPCIDPCGAVKRLGLDKKDGGGVICCGGKQYPCGWLAPEANAVAGKAMDDCVTKHEQCHIDNGHQSCSEPRCNNTTYCRPPYINISKEHQFEWTCRDTEITCLLGTKCGGDSVCTAKILSRVRDLCRKQAEDGSPCIDGLERLFLLNQ
jgi:hypothetical protein